MTITYNEAANTTIWTRRFHLPFLPQCLSHVEPFLHSRFIRFGDIIHFPWVPISIGARHLGCLAEGPTDRLNLGQTYARSRARSPPWRYNFLGKQWQFRIYFNNSMLSLYETHFRILRIGVNSNLSDRYFNIIV